MKQLGKITFQTICLIAIQKQLGTVIERMPQAKWRIIQVHNKLTHTIPLMKSSSCNTSLNVCLNWLPETLNSWLSQSVIHWGKADWRHPQPHIKSPPSKTDPLLVVPAVLKYLPQGWAMQYHTLRKSAPLRTRPSLTTITTIDTYQVCTRPANGKKSLCFLYIVLKTPLS